jgi:hypothetical protein
MTQDQKFATGVLLLIVGVIWLFFVVIWMPPLAFAVFYAFALLRVVPSESFGHTLYYVEYTMPLCLIGYAIYLLVRNRAKTIK